MFKGTEEGITIIGEFFNDGLFAAELALEVDIASIKFVGQLGTVVRMGMSGGPDGTHAGRCALISLDIVVSMRDQVV